MARALQASMKHESCTLVGARHEASASACHPGAAGGGGAQTSATGTRTRVTRVRAEYPSQLDYSGFWKASSRGKPAQPGASAWCLQAVGGNGQSSCTALQASLGELSGAGLC